MPTPVHRFMRRYPRSLFAIAALAVFATAVYAIADEANKNRQSIEKGCILLNNAIVQSSATASDPKSPSSALIAGIMRVIPPQYVKLYETRLKKQGPTILPLINCRKVADHPDAIRAIPLRSPH